MQTIINRITENVEKTITDKLLIKPCESILHIFYLSDDIPSLKYINNKIKKALKFNVQTILHKPINLVDLENKLVSIPIHDKVIIQYPIKNEVFGDIKKLYQEYIKKEQDIDGFLFDLLDINSCNTLDDFLNHKSFSPTAKGVLQILKELNVKIEGCNITVIGKGLTSGLPIGNSISKIGGNLTWLDKNTKKDDFSKTITNSDVIISCTGAKNIINKDTHSLKDNAIYINIGMSSDENGVIVGDINYNEISLLENTLYINDVLKSTGYLTTLNLIANCI